MFWVLPCLDAPESRFVVYTEYKQEILVVVKAGRIVSQSAPLSDAHRAYFDKNILTNYRTVL
jgi:hypothetical protein